MDEGKKQCTEMACIYKLMKFNYLEEKEGQHVFMFMFMFMFIKDPH